MPEKLTVKSSGNSIKFVLAIDGNQLINHLNNFRMKNVKWFLMLFVATAMFLSACKKDDDDKGKAIEITGIEISDDNSLVEVTFNQSLYRLPDKTGNLGANSFSLTFTAQSPIQATYMVEHTAGSNKVKFHIGYQTRLRGTETLEVKALANTIYGAEGNPLKQTIASSINVKDMGIIGKWKAFDISAILIGLGFDDSLYADFRADRTYLVRAYMGGFPIVLEGTFTQNKTNYNNIWEITVNQAKQNGQPVQLTSQGIFQVIYEGSQAMMWYEVAQVEPAIAGVTPPTAAQGFGSTSGGAFGMANVQKYNWIGQ